MTYASETGHWYDWEANPRHTYIDKDGEQKPTTLRQARKWNLLPSFSAIEGCRAKPALTNWMMNGLADICYDNQPMTGETKEGYRNRVRMLDRDQRAKAPDLGTEIHDCIEKHLRGEQYDQEHRDRVVAAVACVDNWCGLDDVILEQSFAHPLGYGGRCDIHKKWKQQTLEHVGWLADFKTKDFGEDDYPDIYSNHTMQLAAYRDGLGMPAARGAIIYISTRLPGLVRLVEAPQGAMETAWEQFQLLLRYWQIEKQYTPQKGTQND